MAVCLDVTYVSQLNYGGGMNDPTGCWYCSAQMVGFYFEQGPRQGVPEFHVGGQHMSTGDNSVAKSFARNALQAKGFVNEHEALAKREGMSPVAECETNKEYVCWEVEDLLRAGGPIFFYWKKTRTNGASYGHASVLIGVDERTREIIYHDPEGTAECEGGSFRRMKIVNWYTLRQKWKYAMMQRADKGDTAIRAFDPSLF